MERTFAYDLIGFLRVLYRRRMMILKGTLGVTVLVAIASLIWPQTWRADARILVSTPKYKETLRLVPTPFDVLTYEGVMASDQTYSQIIDTLKWYKKAVLTLVKDQNYLNRIQAHLGDKAQGMTPFQKIQHSNLEILSTFLIPEGERNNPLWKNRISMLGHLNAEELEEASRFDDDELDDLTVFDLRKMLFTNVAKVRETNLEVEYSRVIRVSAEFDSAIRAKMMANTWLDLFLARAEEIVRRTIENQIQLTQQRAADLEKELNVAQKALADYEKNAHLRQLRAELASKLVQLTGMTPNRRIADRVEESFNLEDDTQPFMKERQEKMDSLSFAISHQYDEALLPRQLNIEGEIRILESLLKKNPLGNAHTVKSEDQKHNQELLEKKEQLEAELISIKNQIRSLTREIALLWEKIRQSEADMETLRRQVTKKQSALTAMQPLLDEAALLESRGENIRYADVSMDRAIKPDKRVFPKRSLMTAIGMVVSFILCCFLAFFLDIWQEVVKPEETQEATAAVPPGSPTG